MSLIHLFLIAIVQGITEFLPISSSAHLILLPYFGGYEDQGYTLDVAVHIGTLAAVILYFWQDVKGAVLGTPRMLRGDISSEGARTALLLAIATIPAIVLGLFLKLTGVYDLLRSIAVIGWAMLGFGILLWWMDQKSATTKTAAQWSVKEAWILGLWQAVALIPGTSRSGITITGARALGYTREDSVKISMLMSIPTILASGAFLGVEVAGTITQEELIYCLLGAALSCIAALIALRLMIVMLRSISFTPYVIYRIILGLVLLAIAYT